LLQNKLITSVWGRKCVLKKYYNFGLEASYLGYVNTKRVIECEQDCLLFSKKASFYRRIDPCYFMPLGCARGLTRTFGKKYFLISPCADGLGS